MISNLPTPIASYISAENRGDAETVADYFTEDAVVHDEAQIHRGLAAIRRWMAETKRKYQTTMEPLAVTRKDDKVIVTNRLTGNFPGSPIELEFVFALVGDKIAVLEILS